MFNIQQLKDNSIIITPEKVKEGILDKINFLDLNVKFISKNELIKNTCFNYDDKTIAYLIKKGYSYNNAKEIIKNLYFIKEGNSKLTNLYQIKKELIEHKLINKNFNYAQLFVNKNVYVYGYSKYDKEIIWLLNKLNVNPIYLEDEETNFSHKVFEFDTIEEEVDHVLNEIALLAGKGVSLNKIKLFSCPREYQLIVKKYADFYGLPINFKENIKAINSPYCELFLNKYDETNLLEAYNFLVENIEHDNYHFLNKLKNIIIDIEGVFSNRVEEKTYLINKLKDVKLSDLEYKEAIDIIDYNYLEDDCVFIMGFNLLNYPLVKKDVTYLNDKEKNYLGINTSLDENQIDEERICTFIKTHKNLYITYKKYVGKDEYYPSLLIDSLGLIKEKGKLNLVRSSLAPSKILVCKAKDLKDSFGMDSELLNALTNQMCEYKTYSHDFKHFPEIENHEFQSFSYSRIDAYNRCPFNYYLTYILKVDDYEESFTIKQGNFYHKILEDYIDKGITKEEINIKIEEAFPDLRERFFVSKNIDLFYQTFTFNQKFHKQKEDLISNHEYKVSHLLDEKTNLFGFIDNLIISKDNNAFIVVDYKSGNTVFDINKVQYGLSSQILIYSLLINKNHPEYRQMGAFIQNILKDKGKDKQDADPRFKGVMKYDPDLLSVFDNKEYNRGSSTLFLGLSIKNGEYVKSTRTLSNEEWEELLILAENKTKESIENIRNAKFDIAPIQFDNNDRSLACGHCKNQAICFKNRNDIRNVSLKGSDSNED